MSFDGPALEMASFAADLELRRGAVLAIADTIGSAHAQQAQLLRVACLSAPFTRSAMMRAGDAI